MECTVQGCLEREHPYGKPAEMTQTEARPIPAAARSRRPSAPPFPGATTTWFSIPACLVAGHNPYRRAECTLGLLATRPTSASTPPAPGSKEELIGRTRSVL